MKQLLRKGVSSPSVSRSAGSLNVLLVSPDDEDYVSLEQILKPNWTVIANTTVTSSLSLLRTVALPIAFCDADLSGATWQGMLDHVSHLPDPPLFIVTSRLADDYLWAEALNLGAWNVLAKPFNPEEVIRTVDFAWRHWQDRHGVHTGRTPQRKTVTSARYLSATGT